MIRLLDKPLNRICIAAVIFVVGVAVGVILERSIASPDDSSAGTEAIAENDAETINPEENEAETAVKEEPTETQAEDKKEEPKTEDTKPEASSSNQSLGSYESLSEAEKSDLKYMKESDAWSSSEVKSPRFKEMFTQLNNGNIDCLVSIFSGLEKDYVNGYVVRIVADIPKLSSEEREKAKKYLCESKGEAIKLSWAAKKIGDMAR